MLVMVLSRFLLLSGVLLRFSVASGGGSDYVGTVFVFFFVNAYVLSSRLMLSVRAPSGFVKVCEFCWYAGSISWQDGSQFSQILREILFLLVLLSIEDLVRLFQILG